MLSAAYVSAHSKLPILQETEFSITNAEPVRTVRLDFGKTPPINIAIDAVEISGPGGTQWASDARASSDNSASAKFLRPRQCDG